MQLDRHQQAGNAGANNAGAERRAARFRHIAAPLHRLWVRRIHHGFFADQRHVFFRHLSAHADRQHAPQQMRWRFGGQRAARLRVIQQHITEPCAQCGPQRIRGRFVEIPGALDVRGQAIKPFRLTGQMHQHHQQGRDIAAGQRLIQ